MYFPKSEGNSPNIFWTHISGCLWRIVHQLEEENVDELYSKASQKYANLDDKNELCSKTFPSEEIVAGMETLCTRKNRRRMHFLLKERTIWILFLAIMDYLLTTIILERAEWKRVFVQMSKSPILASGCGAIFGEASLSFSTFSALLESPKKSSRMNRQPTHLPPTVESLMARSLAHRCIATKPTDLRCYRGDLENLGEISKARGAHRAPATIVTLVSGYKSHIFRIF